jgi:hypothetical protein
MAIRDINLSQGIIITAFAFRSAGEVPRPPEAMQIPVLIDSNIYQLRGQLERIEIDRAIKTLTSSDLLRLQRFAKFRVRGLGRAASGRDWEDLLGEALYRTLKGTDDTKTAGIGTEKCLSCSTSRAQYRASRVSGSGSSKRATLI